MAEAGVGNVGRHAPLSGRGGQKLIMPVRPALARDRVMHVGEPVAMVIAETAAAAQDGAERVVVANLHLFALDGRAEVSR